MDLACFLNLLSKFYVLTIIFFSLLVHEVILTVRSAARFVGFYRNPEQLSMTNRYLALIEETLPVIRFGNGPGPWPAECAVCICKFERGEEVRELKCKHLFHKDCLDGWLEHRGDSCPMCRDPMLPEAAMIERWRSEQEYSFEDHLAHWLFTFHGSRHHGLNIIQKMDGPDHQIISQHFGCMLCFQLFRLPRLDQVLNVDQELFSDE